MTKVKVAGRMTSEHVPQLEEECGASERPVVLDLSELQGLDRLSVVWLRSLVGRGGKIAGQSAYIDTLLGRARPE